VEGNTYSIVNIGTQVWMAENMKATRYNNNTPIANVTSDAAWAVLGTPAYCWFNNDIANKNVYGAMYNWYTIRDGNVCPTTGWHVPTDDEYATLELYLGMTSGSLPGQVWAWGWRGTDQGAQMKSTTGWASGENGTNTSGFSALPGGYRFAENGAFNDLGNLTYWWTSTEADLNISTYRRLDGVNSGVFRGSVQQEGGKYIRCVKNN
jgi:uncharacterized protein (TIGR02145 family)